MRTNAYSFSNYEKSTQQNHCSTLSNRVLRFLVLSIACAGIPSISAAAQSLQVISVHPSKENQYPQAVKFFCTQDYNSDECKINVLSLLRELVQHPIEQLGPWSFVLVPPDRWSNLVRQLGGNPVSPAFSILNQRTTVFDGSLFSANGDRNRELLVSFGMIGKPLLSLAITHELGHALCQEKDERRADVYGRKLREHREVQCLKSTEQ